MKPKKTRNKHKTGTNVLIFNYCPILGLSYNVVKIYS